MNEKGSARRFLISATATTFKHFRLFCHLHFTCQGDAHQITAWCGTKRYFSWK